MSRLLLLLPALLASVTTMACSDPPETTRPAGDPLEPRRLYPLAEGNIWTYDIDTGTGMSTLGILRCHRVADGAYEVRPDGGDPNTYEVRSEGIWWATKNTWLLRRPIRVGSTWESVNGRTAAVTSVSESVRTTGGNFEGCVLIEETGGAANRPQRTTYCPDVGPVRIEASQQMQLSGQEVTAVGTLRSYLFPEE